MKNTIEIMLTVPVAVKVEREYDDDGCGSPSVTGNSMTGCRGSYWVVTSVEFDGTDAAAREAINAALEEWVGSLDADEYAPE